LLLKFNKGLLQILFGSILSQILPFFLLPFLTREVGSEVMGDYSLYLSIYSILIIFSTLRYDLAIVVEKDQENSKKLVGVSIVISFFISILLMVFVLLFNEYLWDKLNTIGNYLFLLPISIFMGTLMQLCINVFNRNAHFLKISIIKLLFALISSILPFLFIYFDVQSNAIINSFIIGQLASAIFALIYLKDYLNFNELYHFFDRKILSLHKEYPLVNLPSSLLDSIAGAMPLLYITSVFGSSEAGFFSLMNRVLMIPSSLIQFTFATYFFGRFAELNRKGENFRKYLFTTILVLISILIVPFLILMIAGSDVFIMIFGEEWLKSGKFTEIYSMAALLKTVISPFILTFAVLNKLKIVAFWQAGYFIGNLIIILCGFKFLDQYLIALTILDITSYLLCLFILFVNTKSNE
jgi:O-antigen/teichoic acid export membrane protein